MILNISTPQLPTIMCVFFDLQSFSCYNDFRRSVIEIREDAAVMHQHLVLWKTQQWWHFIILVDLSVCILRMLREQTEVICSLTWIPNHIYSTLCVHDIFKLCKSYINHLKTVKNQVQMQLFIEQIWCVAETKKRLKVKTVTTGTAFSIN